MALDCLHHVTRRQIVERHNARAGRPARQQLVLAIIEAQRQHRERPVAWRELQVVRHADRAEPEIGVAQHHALWKPGRPRCVEDRRQRIDVGIGRRQAIAIERHPVLHRDRTFIRHVARFEQACTHRLRQQQPRAAIGQDMRDLRAFERRIDRHMDQPGARRGERHHAGQPRLGQPGRDAVTGLEPLPAQPCRHCANRRLQRGVIDRPAPVLQRDIARRPAKGQVVDRARDGIERSHVRLDRAARGRHKAPLPPRACLSTATGRDQSRQGH